MKLWHDRRCPPGRTTLRIGVLSTIAWATPPAHYGPWELIAHLCAEGFAAAGHDVTLFATANSETAGKLNSVAPCGYWEDRTLDVKVHEGLHIAAAFERAEYFDVIHNHFDFLPLTYSRVAGVPIVTTIHGFSSERILPVYEAYDDVAFYVAISKSSRHPALTYAAIIHHGINLDDFTFRGVPGDYLVLLGRVDHDKGAREAIEVARRTGLRLLIAGIVSDSDYFRDWIEPAIDGDHVQYLGSVGPVQRDRLLGHARALLHLVNFDEPFGLSVVESMATGTPVIACPRGALPEIVVHGKTGFLVSSVEEAVSALACVTTLDRWACRAHVERHFTAERMVREYLGVFEQILGLEAGQAGGVRPSVECSRAPQPA